MAFTTTRDRRADRWRTIACLVGRHRRGHHLSIFCAAGSIAQVKTPAKSQFKAPPRRPPRSPTDTQADQLNEKWLSEFNKADKPATARQGRRPRQGRGDHSASRKARRRA